MVIVYWYVILWIWDMNMIYLPGVSETDGSMCTVKHYSPGRKADLWMVCVYLDGFLTFFAPRFVKYLNVVVVIVIS